MDTKVCSICGKEKPLTLDFFMRGTNQKVPYWYNFCKECYNKKAKVKNSKYRKKNKEILKVKKKEYYQNNKNDPEFQETRRQSRHNGKSRRRENEKLKRKIDPIFRLRDNVRTMIRLMIFNNYGSKSGSSINEYLPFTIQELKKHLENQFEPWMTWDNHGKYNVKIWNDNDQSTWTWQIDHIVPQSELPYQSMNDNNFQKCWSLSNLRPLSAKTNSIDGAKRTRHKVGI
jgi:hypothetical protein